MEAVLDMQGVPFVVESVSPTRVKLWAKRAQTATSAAALDEVEWAFDALSCEAHAYEVFQEVMRRIQEGWASAAMGWMAHLVIWAEMSVKRWEHVAVSIAEDEANSQRAMRWYTDASERWQSLLTLAHTVRAYATVFAEQWGVPLPQELQTSPGEE